MAPISLEGHQVYWTIIVQRRVTNFITNYSDLDYRNWLINYSFFEIADSYYVFSKVNKVIILTVTSSYDFIEFCSQPTRYRGSSNFKILKHKLCKTDFDRNFYFNCIPWLWNSLSTLDINLPLSTIKSHLWLFLWDHFMSIVLSIIMYAPLTIICPCPKCSKHPVNMHFSH